MRSAWDQKIATKGMTIGERLMVKADELTKFLPLTAKSRITMTLREDLSNTISDRRH